MANKLNSHETQVNCSIVRGASFLACLTGGMPPCIGPSPLQHPQATVTCKRSLCVFPRFPRSFPVVASFLPFLSSFSRTPQNVTEKASHGDCVFVLAMHVFRYYRTVSGALFPTSSPLQNCLSYLSNRSCQT